MRCITCVTGVTGCRWHRHQQSTDPSKKCDILWFWLLICALLCMAFWFYYWLIAGNSMDDANWFLYIQIGKFIHWYLILFVLAIIIFAYCLIMFVLAMIHVGCGHQIYIHWSHRVMFCIVFVSSVFATIILTMFWPQAWGLQRVSLMTTGPFLHVYAVALMTVLSWFILSWFIPTRQQAQNTSIHHNAGQAGCVRMVLFICYVLVLAALYVVPIFIESPCITDIIPPKPKLVGHRGASGVAPEDTIAGIEYATKQNVAGFECDITVSFDGVPFLMHDETLKRTTNVEDVFPGRENIAACLFNISQLQQLDAGSWYIKDNPFLRLHSLSEAEKSLFRNQTVPTLSEVLRIARDADLFVKFDIKFDCKDHPYEHNYTDVIVKTISEVGLPDDKVWWLHNVALLPSHVNYPPVSMNKDLSPAELSSAGVYRVNLELQHVFLDKVRAYHAHNVSVSVWTANSPWLFSLHWCMGVDYITTNTAHWLNSLDRPVWHLTPREFRLMWGVTDGISFVIILIMALYHYVDKRVSSISLFTDKTHQPFAIYDET